MNSEGLSGVVASGSRRRSLELMRDKLASELDGASGRDAATLSKELREVMRELDQIPTGEEASKSDDLAKQRADRLAAAAAAQRPPESE